MKILIAVVLVFTLMGCRTGAVSESKVDSKLAKPAAAVKVVAPDASTSEARSGFAQDPSSH